MREPLWKTVLNWGAVISFLMLPLVILTIQIYANTHPGWWQWADSSATAQQRHEHFRYLSDFLRNLTILVFGLAGLRTWETVKHNGNGKEGKHEPA